MTACEMRISDWSSDVCSSELVVHVHERERRLSRLRREVEHPQPCDTGERGPDVVHHRRQIPSHHTAPYQRSTVATITATAGSRRSSRRSADSRVGKECGITCRSRWSPYH